MSKSRASALLARSSRAVSMDGFELRSAGDTLTLEGYASTFGQDYSMGWYTEVVRPGAFTKTLTQNPDVRLLLNHDGLPLARTKSGTMQLSADSTGLHVRAHLDPNDPDVKALQPKMARGDLDEMSFGFRTIRDEWSEDYQRREMVELALDDGDVSIVTYPANPTTSATLRSLSRAAVERPDRVRALYAELREGKTLSAASVAVLTSVLETLSVIDGHVDQVDVDLDAAQQQLSDLLGVANPDPVDPETPDTQPIAETNSKRGVSAFVKAQAEWSRYRTTA